MVVQIPGDAAFWVEKVVMLIDVELLVDVVAFSVLDELDLAVFFLDKVLSDDSVRLVIPGVLGECDCSCEEEHKGENDFLHL